MIGRGKAVQPPSGAHPPLAAFGLQRDVPIDPAPAPGPAGVTLEGFEPVEPLPIETAQPRVVNSLVTSQRIQLCSFEYAGLCVSEDTTPETQVTCPVFEDRMHFSDAVLFAVGGEAAARQLHRSRSVRAQPQIAAEIFIERGDVGIT